jgi:hypothetical protein
VIGCEGRYLVQATTIERTVHAEIKTPDRHRAVRVSETQSSLAEEVTCKEISTISPEHYLWIVYQIVFFPPSARTLTLYSVIYLYYVTCVRPRTDRIG